MNIFQMLDAIAAIADQGATQRQRLLALASDLIDASQESSVTTMEKRDLRIAGKAAERAAYALPPLREEVAQATRQINRD